MELINLTWDVYSENSCNTMRNLYSDTTFTDVTLVTEDEKEILAHKVVLASSSCFFKKLMKMKNVKNHQNPLLYLKGIKFSLLNSIIKFIYLGETEINRNEIENFMMIGKDLEISGLDLNSSQTNLKKKKRVHFKLENEKDYTAGQRNNDTDMSIGSDLESSIEDHEAVVPSSGEPPLDRRAEGESTRYDCTTCHQSYSRQDNLSRHKSLAHGELLI